MLEISILTLLLCETCIVIRKSSHVRDIDSDSVAIRDSASVIRKSSHVRDIDSDSVAITRPASLLERAEQVISQRYRF